MPRIYKGLPPPFLSSNYLYFTPSMTSLNSFVGEEVTCVNLESGSLSTCSCQLRAREKWKYARFQLVSALYFKGD